MLFLKTRVRVQLAAYVPECKGAPGFVGVWPLGQLSKAESPPPVARRSFFRVCKHSTVFGLLCPCAS